MELLQSFQAFIQTNYLLRPDERVLLAVSGGVDSVVMAHLFRESRWPFAIVHCNFQLRGAESDADEAFVRDLAAAWEVAFFSRKFDTKKQAASAGQSTQMAARVLRYDWFEQLRRENNYDAVAIAHHRDDSVETALFHFIRGTGLSGLAGIPVRNEYLIRPLLFAGREAIMAHAREKGILWREDSSNASDDYTRNVIRRRLIPRMQEINPAFLTAAAQTLKHVRAADENLRFLLGRLLGLPDTSGKYRMNKKELEALPAPADALFDLLQPFGFTPEQMRQLMENWRQTGTEWTSGSGFRLLNDRQELLLFQNTPAQPSIRIDADDIMVGLPDASRLIFVPAEPIAPTENNYAAVVVDADKLRFPLLLRRWQPGDVFQPLGMGGHSRKLQDFFTDKKLSRLEKEQVWILENGDKNIIWIVGMRLDERFKMETETSNLLKISWVKHL